MRLPLRMQAVQTPVIPVVAELLKAKHPVLLIDAFQTGSAVAPRERSSAIFLGFNQSDDACRVQDILTALAFLVVALIQVRIDAGERPHIIWQILAFLVLTAAEVMVSVTHLEFAYTQAPRKMKSLVMCTYLGAVALGNVFTAAVNFLIQNPDGTVKLAGASYFYFFAKIMLATSVLFLFVARFYRGKTYIQNEATAQPA